MAKQNFTYYVKRDQNKKRPQRHKKSLNKSEKRMAKKQRFKGQGK